ncbi:exodeoxyribonuclease V subunit alpha [Skermania piniformis]|uniref:RecBCD enzyme subunit RecD n=1 Tax=Skermania pinensis TaxID=39122 RepID=A0ABX8S623_9ACTN|nr:exodeoxyribonuclease V subunit alpha [Skermania piniformis]QXQ12439.1 exodeoxyribonuclease V subunit alpha [Skermania piniformis]
MIDGSQVQRANGLIREFNAAGVLAAGDVHVALRLGRLAGESDEQVLLATALVVRAVRAGSVCLDLRRMRDVAVDGGDAEPDRFDPAALPWPSIETVLAGLRRSPLVQGAAAGPLRPLRLVQAGGTDLLYLARYHRQEQTVRRILDERARTAPMIDVAAVETAVQTLFPDPPPDRQRLAAVLAVTRWTTLVAGGPGTGKTHTVARILALLNTVEPGLRIGLAAPTGKAAVRLQDEVRGQAASLELSQQLSAVTLHRLLGWHRGRARFRFGAANRLPYDVVVVDETSMVSLTLMCRLLEAIRPDARLVLVGDPDQLASVEAGAVLADLVGRPLSAGVVASADEPILAGPAGADVSSSAPTGEPPLTADERERLRGGIVRLVRGRRFGGAIADLAGAIRDSDADRTLALLHSGDEQIEFVPPGEWTALRADVVACAGRVRERAEVGDAVAALRELERHRLLCAHRDGPFGVGRWQREALGWVAQAQQERLDPHGWYPGQPLLVTANDYESRIYNGDTGVVVRRDGALVGAFQRGGDPFVLHPSQLPAVQTAYAMTIHRSQGSQYDAVTVLLPSTSSALLTRELLYTAVTRARHRVRLLGTDEVVRAAVQRRAYRASGLRWLPESNRPAAESAGS